MPLRCLGVAPLRFAVAVVAVGCINLCSLLLIINIVTDLKIEY